jgi:hypothetical protein
MPGASLKSQRALLPMLCVAGVQFVAACTAPPEPRLLHLDNQLSLLKLGPISDASGSLHRSAGFTRATVELRAPPEAQFDTIAHWHRVDGSGVPEGPTDQRHVASGPAGLIALEFVAPTLDARDLLIELAPSNPTSTSPSPF